jgi:hypothetical protein
MSTSRPARGMDADLPAQQLSPEQEMGALMFAPRKLSRENGAEKWNDPHCVDTQ